MPDLGDGLILRRATPDDVERLAEFNALVFARRDAGAPDLRAAAAVRDLADGNHPTCRATDFTLVEDTRTGAVVSSLVLIPQVWTYDGIAFPVGRPENVGTHPGYRDRGLVRAQFEMIHRWAAERGDLLLAITGIPWFYRQFGYEMAVDLDAARTGYPATVPRLATGAAEPCRLRPATLGDVPFLVEVHARGTRRSLLACPYDAAMIRYELDGRREASPERHAWRVVESLDGRPLGFLIHARSLRGTGLDVFGFELGADVSWGPATGSVLRYLRTTGEEYARRDGNGPCESYHFGLGTTHPAYDALPSAFPVTPRPYAWYLRVPDLPAYLRHVAPALDRRLAYSILAGHTGELRLSFYRDGVRLVFASGALADVSPWKPTRDAEGDARFPGLTFLQLLFGYRTLDELEYAFPDVRIASDATRALLVVLFPKRPSRVWGIS
jgi:hypothetical protein